MGNDYGYDYTYQKAAEWLVADEEQAYQKKIMHRWRLEHPIITELGQEMMEKYTTPTTKQNPRVRGDNKPMNNDLYNIDQVDIDVANELNKRQTERLLKTKMNLVDALGEDVFVDGDVITFSKKFDNNGDTYQYVALKVGDVWYVTGRNNYSLAWEKLVGFLVSGKFPTKSFTKMVPVTA